MFETDFTLKNETENKIQIVTMIDGAVKPLEVVLEPNDEMVNFRPPCGHTSIIIRSVEKEEK